MTMRNFAEHGKIVSLQVPDSISAMAPKFANIRNYYSGYIHVVIGAASAAGTLVVRQAQNVAGSGIKDLALLRYYTNLVTSSPQEEEDLWYEVDNSANSATVITLAAQTQYIIPWKPAKLDVDNDFDCVGVEITGATALEVGVSAVLTDGVKGIVGDLDHIPSARVNNMQ